MSTIKNLVVQGIAVTILAGAYIIGANTAQVVWDEVLEDKVIEKTRKWFSK